MTLGPYPLTGVMQRLAPVSPLRFIGISADLATALKTPPTVVPAAYVVREERARDTTYGTGVQVQRIDAAIAVVYFVRNYRESDSGAAAREEMDALIALGREQLLGYRPSGEFTGLCLQSSNENLYGGALLISQEVYLSTYRTTKVPT
ncbi:MAG TPA: hypothetical protein VLF18_11920 [Tahibacter sp.]|uniref:phage tail terminator protein n=1 Tax=Tahibacter sp. TaxID=2056211 RepID=UPI002B9AB163|nr:hypothetical protein [Tahibacter sp.]HSX60899.1 hypothetical protein [Tahibacter sp.]